MATDKLPDPLRLLTIVIPARNEEGCIASTVQHLNLELKLHHVPHEIVVVDDGSTDATWAILTALGTQVPELRPVQNEDRHGFGCAIIKGLDVMEGDAAVIMMADESDDCRDVVRYWKLLQEGCDCVFGSRFIKGGGVIDYPWLKLRVNRLANLFIRLLFNIKLNDTTNAFKAYRKTVIDGCRPYLSPHFNLTVELPLKAIVRGFSWTTIPITWRNRRTGEAKLKLREMGSRYFFIVAYVWLEKYFSRGDYHAQKPMPRNPCPETHAQKPMPRNPCPETHALSGSGRMNPPKSTAVVVNFFAAALLVLMNVLVFGHPAYVDEIFFKAAGLHWADGNGWRAPEEKDFLNWQPPLQEVFASYPPIYPFLFGLIVKCVGFNQTVANAYDACIHIVLGLVLVRFAKRAFPERPLLAWWLGFLFLLCWYPSRPDRLAMIFGYFALGSILSPHARMTARSDFSAGVALGLCVATSIPCGIAIVPLLVGVYALRGASVSAAIKAVARVGAVSTIAAGIAIAPVLLYHPDAWRQNIMATSTVANHPFWQSIQHLLQQHLPSVGCLILLLVPSGFVAIRMFTSGSIVDRKESFLWFILPVFPLLFLSSKSAVQGNYYWFVIPWLAVGLGGSFSHLKLIENNRWLVLTTAFVLPVAFGLRNHLGSVLTAGDQQVANYRAEVEALVPPNVSVLAADYWWLLARRNQVFDRLNHGALTEEDVEYIVLTGHGSGAAGRPQTLPPFATLECYEVVHENLSPERPAILGFPLSRSTLGAGPIVWKRKPIAQQP